MHFSVHVHFSSLESFDHMQLSGIVKVNAFYYKDVHALFLHVVLGVPCGESSIFSFNCFQLNIVRSKGLSHSKILCSYVLYNSEKRPLL